MLADNSPDEMAADLDSLELKEMEKAAPLGDFDQDEAMHMLDWWRNFTDGRYDNLPAT